MMIYGLDVRGFDKDGNYEGEPGILYDEKGYDREGYDRAGYDEIGYDREGYDENGFNPEGIHRNGTKYNEYGHTMGYYADRDIDLHEYMNDHLDGDFSELMKIEQAELERLEKEQKELRKTLGKTEELESQVDKQIQKKDKNVTEDKGEEEK